MVSPSDQPERKGNGAKPAAGDPAAQNPARVSEPGVPSSRTEQSEAKRPAEPRNDGASRASHGNGTHKRPRKHRRLMNVVIERPRKRHWVRKTLIGLAIALIVIIVAVQIVLSSSLPKTIILKALEKSLGVRAEAASVSTGWWGHTAVNDVKLTIPLDDGPFVEARQIRVSHTSLIMMLINGLEVEDMQVDKPIVHLRQGQSGRWNFSDLLGGMTRAGGAGGDAGAKPDRPKIPAIDIRGATLQVTDRNGKFSRVGPFDFLGEPDQSAPDLVWKYTFNLPNQVRIDGRAVTGGDWRNEAKIQVTDLNPLVSPFVGSRIPDVKFVGRWQGRAPGGVEGQVAIESLSVPGAFARGVLAISESPAGVNATPQNLQVFTHQPAAADRPMLVLTGGSIDYADAAVKLNKLTASAGGGVAQLEGSFFPGSRTGELSATWANLGVPNGIKHEGKLKFSLGQSLTGEMEITGDIETNGQLTSGASAWAGKIAVNGGGKPDDLTIRVSFPHFTLRSNQKSFPLDGLAIQAAISDKLGARPGGDRQQTHPGMGIALESVKLGTTERLAASGYFLPATKVGDQALSYEWDFKMRGSHWPLPLVDVEGLGITLAMKGDDRIVHIDDVRIAGAETVVNIKGSYEFDVPKPLKVTAELTHKPPETAIAADALGAKRPPQKIFWGGLAGTGDITGTLDPIDLRMTGQMQGLAVKVFGHDIGDMSLKVAGEANDNYAMVYRDPSAQPLNILGGKWELKVIHALKPLVDEETAEVKMPAGSSEVAIRMSDLPLENIGELADDEKVTGTANGWWEIYLPATSDVQHQLEVDGELEATKIKAHGIDLDSLTATTKVEKGVATLGLDVRRLAGKFTGEAAFSVDNPKLVELRNLQLEHWPLQVPPSTYLTLEASAPHIEIYLPDEKSPDPAARKMHFASGPIQLDTPVKVGDVDAGKASFNAVLKERTIHIPLIDAPLFGSQITAQATIPLDDLNKMTALLHVRNADPHQIAKIIPPFRSLTGLLNVDLSVGPTDDPNATEPLAVEMWLTPTQGNLVYRQSVAPPIDDNDTPLTIPPGGTSRPTTTAAVTGAVPTAAPSLAPAAAAANATNVPSTMPAVPDDRGPGIQMGLGRFRLLARFDDKYQLDRVVLADQSGTKPPPPRNAPAPKYENAGQLPVNTLQVSGGTMTFWGRMTRNENEYGVKGLTTVSMAGRVAFADLDLNQIMQAFKPDKRATPGRLHGEIVVNGATGLDLRERSRRPRLGQAQAQPADDFMARLIGSMQGEGKVTLENSDLANVKMIAALYNMLRTDVRTPTGHGSLTFRLEKSNAYITAFRYFNRGVEVRAVGEVRHLDRGRDATVRATAYGSIRTLKDVKLPIIRSIVPDLDQIVSAIQQNGVSVFVSGTVFKPKVDPVLFSDLGAQMRELLIGDYRQANDAPPQQ
jgi:hypothetical protein